MKNDKPKMGRPPTPPPEILRPASVRLNDRQKAKLAAGGGQWLRDLIDAAPAPKKKPPEGG